MPRSKTRRPTPTPTRDAAAAANGATFAFEWLERLQRLQTEALRGWQADTTTAATEAGEAGRPQDLMTVQIAFTAEQWARAQQLWTQLLSDWLDMQTVWTRALGAPWVPAGFDAAAAQA